MGPALRNDAMLFLPHSVCRSCQVADSAPAGGASDGRSNGSSSLARTAAGNPSINVAAAARPIRVAKCDCRVIFVTFPQRPIPQPRKDRLSHTYRIANYRQKPIVRAQQEWVLQSPERQMPKPRETLERIGLLRTLDRKERESFERRCQWRHAKAKEWLLEQNDLGTDLYFLASGVVRVLITPTPDHEVILGDIEAGGYFGEMAAIDGRPRSAGILAITDAAIACMPAKVFRELLHDHPEVSTEMLQHLVSRIRALDQRVNEFSSMDVKHRIYAELLRRSRADPTDQHRALISPPPVHSDIAARVSTRREMVARELKSLERKGLLAKRRGAFVLTNVPVLVEMVNRP